MEQNKYKLIKLTSALRPRDNLNRDIKLLDYSGETITELILKTFPKDQEIIASINGKVIPYNEYSTTTLNHKDELLLVPDIRGDDSGKSILRIVLMIAIMVIAWQVAPYLVTTFGGTQGLWAAGIMMVGGLLVGALLPNNIKVDAPEKEVHAYSWNPQTTQQQGIVIPKYYGINKLYGNIISAYIESDDDDQIINILVCLGIGPIKSISSVKINDQLHNLYKNVDIETRLGTLRQPVCSNFSDTKVETEYNDLVSYGSTVTKAVTMSGYDDLEIEVTFPNGLWYSNDEGGLDAYKVSVQTEVLDNGTWVVASRDINPSVNPSIPVDGTWYICIRRWTFSTKEMPFFIYSTGSSISTDHTEGEYYDTYRGADLNWYLGSTIKKHNYNWNTDPSLDSVSIMGHTYNVIRKTFFYKQAQNVTSIRVAKVTPDKNSAVPDSEESIRYGDELRLTTIRKVVRDDFSYPRQALASVRALSSGQLSGSLKFSCITEGSYIATRTGTYGVGTVDMDTGWPTSIVGNSTSWLANVSIGDLIQIGSDRKTYSIVDLIDNTHASIYPAYTGTSTWSSAYTIHNITFDASHNPAWVATDIITQPVIGPITTGISNWAATTAYSIGDRVLSTKGYTSRFRCIRAHTSGSTEPLWVAGVRAITQVSSLDTWEEESVILRFDGRDPSQIDYASVTNWANFCAATVTNGAGGWEERCTFNGCFDSESIMWEAVLKVCQVGRAVPTWNGVKIGFVYDTISDPVQLFSTGNIIQGTFKETFLSSDERASELEIEFNNSENDYERDQLNVFNTNIDNPSNKVSLQLFGITTPSEAWRYGTYRLYLNELLFRTVTFSADVDAIACTVGDVINVSHEVPQWGYGGKVVSATTNTVTLDRVVTVSGSNDAIMLRLSDDTIVEKTITNSAGTTTVLTTSTNFTTIPSQYDPYTFGVLNIEAKPFKVTNISVDADQICTITAIEYNEDVYKCDTDEPILPSVNYSTLVSYAIPQNLQVSEYGRIDGTGIITRGLDVKWTKPTDCLMKEAVIERTKYASSLDDYGVDIVGKTFDNWFHIEPVEADTQYVVRVYGVNMAGVTTPYYSSPAYTITTSFYPNIIFNNFDTAVTGLKVKDTASTVTWLGGDACFTWDAIQSVSSTITNLWFKDYKVDIKKIDSTLLRTEYVKGNEYTYTYNDNYTDNTGTPVTNFIIEVSPRDIYSNTVFSGITVTSTSIQVNNPVPSVPTSVSVDFSGRDCLFSWEDSNEDLDYYLLVLNSINHTVRGSSFYSYTYNQNKTENTTASATVSYSLKSVDVFGQQSTAVTGTVINSLPSTPTNVGAAFSEKDCLFTWDKDINDDTSYYSLTVNGVEKKPVQNRYNYIFDENKVDNTSAAFTITYSLKTIDIYNQTSSAVSGTATNSVPTTPSGVVVDFTGKDCLFTWDKNNNTNIDYYLLTINSVAKKVKGTNFVYGFDENKKDNTTADPSLSYVLSTVDIFGKASSVVSSTATNTAPATPTGLTVTAYYQTLVIRFTSNAETDIADYEVHVSTSSGFTPGPTTLYNIGPQTDISYEGNVYTTYYVKVRARDIFNQYSDYCAQASATTTRVVSVDLYQRALELEIMKMNFQSIAWTQFSVFDAFDDSSKRASPDPSTYDARVFDSRIDNGIDATPNRSFGFVSKTYTDINVLFTGTSTSVGTNFLADTSKSWWTNQCTNMLLIDSTLTQFTVVSNTSNTLTVSGNPAAGAYKLWAGLPAYAVAFCTYIDSTQGGGYGYIKLEVSFNGGSNYQTFLDTESSINLLEGTVDIANPGNDFIVRITLKNDSSGLGPELYKFLVCTDPSPWTCGS
jgi:sulfur carrier protein ThiS